MESDNRWLSMLRVSTPFPPDGAIRKFASTQRLTPFEDQVSVEIHLAVKTQPIANPALLMTIGSSLAGNKSMARIKAGIQCHIKTKNLFL